LSGKSGIDIDMAGRAGTAAAAQRQQLVKAVVADDFHQVRPSSASTSLAFARPIDNNKFHHIAKLQIYNSASALSLFRQEFKLAGAPVWR
jgi:hypothetical protein